MCRSRHREGDAVRPARTRVLSSCTLDGVFILSIIEKLPPGSSHSGAPVALITGVPAGSTQDVASVVLVRVAPEVWLSTAMSNGPPIACVDVFLTVIR